MVRWINVKIDSSLGQQSCQVVQVGNWRRPVDLNTSGVRNVLTRFLGLPWCESSRPTVIRPEQSRG